MCVHTVRFASDREGPDAPSDANPTCRTQVENFASDTKPAPLLIVGQYGRNGRKIFSLC
jgi:hypothetical protein